MTMSDEGVEFSEICSAVNAKNSIILGEAVAEMQKGENGRPGVSGGLQRVKYRVAVIGSDIGKHAHLASHITTTSKHREVDLSDRFTTS